MIFVIKDIASERVVIAEENSVNELEYTVYKLEDGGSTSIPSSWQDPKTSRYDDILDAVHMLKSELKIPDAEILEIED